MDGSYRTCWTIDEWLEALREAQTSRFVGYDFETCPDRRREDFAPKKVDGKIAKGLPNPLRPERGTGASRGPPTPSIRSHHHLPGGGRK